MIITITIHIIWNNIIVKDPHILALVLFNFDSSRALVGLKAALANSTLKCIFCSANRQKCTHCHAILQSIEERPFLFHTFLFHISGPFHFYSFDLAVLHCATVFRVVQIVIPFDRVAGIHIPNLHFTPPQRSRAEQRKRKWKRERLRSTKKPKIYSCFQTHFSVWQFNLHIEQ